MRARRRGREFTADDLDQNLVEDRLTLERPMIHPVVCSDGGVYEASSVLEILQHNGMSLINRIHPLTFAVPVPAIANTINNFFGENPDPDRDYDLAPVMAEIQALLPQNNQAQADESRIALGLYLSLRIMEGVSTGTTYLSIVGMLLSPILILLIAGLSDSKLGHTADIMWDFLPKAIISSAGALVTSELGLFAGRKMGFFPEDQNERPFRQRNAH